MITVILEAEYVKMISVIKDSTEFAKWQEEAGNIDGGCDPTMAMSLAEDLLESARQEGYIVEGDDLAMPA